MKKNKEENKEELGESFVVNSESVHEDIPLREEVTHVANIYAKEMSRNQQTDGPKIHVDEIASGVAKFYEKIRKIIDWKDDNALRRGAIERILKRRLLPKMVTGVFKEEDTFQLAKTMTEELIRGGHLPNDEIPESRVLVVAECLKKYLYFLKYSIKQYGITNVKEGNAQTNFIIETAACEVEEVLARPVKEHGIIDAMSKIMSAKIRVSPEGFLSEEEKLDLVRISVQRELYHLDNNYIVYMYMRRKYPNWGNLSSEELQWFAKNLLTIKEASEEYVNSKICKKFDEITAQFSAIFILLDDVFNDLKDHPEMIEEKINDKTFLISSIREHYENRRTTLQRRLRNTAIFSTLSVFISNWATFYLIEVPVARLFYEEFNLLATIIDFLLPALVMFLLVIFIKPPQEDNLERVLDASRDLLYQNPRSEKFDIKMNEEIPALGRFFVTLFYIMATILLFVGIGYVFYIAKLPMTSVIYDTFTIAITFYAALGVRKKSKELQVSNDRKFGEFLFDVFTVPVAKVGGFLSSKWKEYNVVAIFTNYLVEVPLVAILDFTEMWSKFIKERKAEID